MSVLDVGLWLVLGLSVLAVLGFLVCVLVCLLAGATYGHGDYEVDE